ncbi:hypothetical protein [Xylanibacter muris]|uniref:Glycosyltransferase RgtA/B/C/D-like domain-containing protein n=1 Tax=Xylanibacter muris TaxID=2736290 RepID=A0ABX2AJ92_9BACT|nr:hypothetical protein [Xylanibacter muris]NPD90838.1 hypothetical protein [Xylanibacter muris]
MTKKRQRYINPLTVILLLSPFIIYALSKLLPISDDWTYFTTPYYDFGEGVYNRIIPQIGYWRPFDGLFGYVLSLNDSLFPTLNHIAVYSGHLGGTILVYHLARILGLKRSSGYMASIFFFISPGMLGTVLGIDSMNQVYSQLWGLTATWLYLKSDKCNYKAAWIICALIATLAKENGTVFLIIPQIIAYGFNRISLKTAMKDSVYALIAITVYFALRIYLTAETSAVNGEYLDNSLFRKIKNIGVFIGLTWLPLDYISLAYKPERNYFTVVITLLLSMPFITVLFYQKRYYVITKECLSLIVCMLIAASPHLVTLFSTMHAYAGLGMAALIICFLTDKFNTYKTIDRLFALFILSCTFIAWHHWQKSYESGLTGKKMAMDIIARTDTPVKNLCVINVIGNEKKYSSFCAIPREAFGWGLSLKHYTGYKWPEKIDNMNFEKYDTLEINRYADMITGQGFERVLVVHGDTIDIIR